VRLLALRGATTVVENTKDEVDIKTQTLVEAMLERNAIEHDDIVSIIFTATDDITAEFPATAARKLGLGDVPLLCARELEIAGSMPRVVRLMAHVETDLPRSDITHVYLHGAAALRSDLTRTRATPDE